MIIWNFFKTLFIFVREIKILNQIYDVENIEGNLSTFMKIRFRRVWGGRLYAVFNPLLDIPEEERIFENTDQGLSLVEFVKKEIMTRLIAVREMLQNKVIFDISTYEIERLDDAENYLFIIKPESWDAMVKATKKFCILLAILLIIAVALCIILL